jgi:hypothetical protein
MKKRKYLVGAVATAVMSISVAGLAQADYTLQGQSLVVDAQAPKLDKKTPGALSSLFVDVITNYTGTTGAVDKKANNTKVYFPKDFVFNTKKLPQCDPNGVGFGTSDTAAAKAACGPGSPVGNAQVGSGSAAIVGPIDGITAVVTAFNGTQPAGLQTILLHSRTSANTTTVLVGSLKASDTGGFGRMLDVPVPPLPLGLAISDFKTTIGKLKLPAGKAASSAKKKKKKKPAKFYIMAKCSKKKWNFQAVSTYDVGSPTTAPASDTCKQKPAKKKKKK